MGLISRLLFSRHLPDNALSGDLGESFVFDEPALELILERMPATLELAVVSLLIAVI